MVLRNWCVVIRKVRDTSSRGQVVLARVSKALAIDTRDEMRRRASMSGWSVWAMEEECY